MKILMLGLLCSASLSAQTALVSHTAIAGNGPTSAINTTGANFGAVCLSAGADLFTSQVVTDSAGNTYHWVANINETDDIYTGLWIAQGIATGSSVTFSTSGPAFEPAIAAAVFSNVASGPDQKNQGEGFSVPFPIGSVAPTNNDELIISCFGGQFLSSTVASPTTQLDTAGSPYAISSGYQVQTSKTAVNPTYTPVSYSNGFAGVTATFYSTLAPAPLVITTSAVPEGFTSVAYTSTGSAYSNQLAATGGVNPYTWSCPTTCNLPTGLSVSSGGLITGTPTGTANAVSVTFKVTDAQSTTQTVTLPMTVASTAVSGGVGTCTGSAITGTQYTAATSCALTAAGGTGTKTFTWSTSSSYSSLPPGRTLSTGGTITGTDYGMGDYVTQFIVTDSLGTFVNFTIQFTLAGNSTFGGCNPAPGGSSGIFNRRVDALPLDTSVMGTMVLYGTSTINPIFGAAPTNNVPNGIPIITVPNGQASVTVATGSGGSGGAPPGGAFTSAPISPNSPIEQTSNGSVAPPGTYISDGHLLTVQQGGANCTLWEQDEAQLISTTWYNNASYEWALNAYTMPQFDNGGTTDAAGLPVAPLLLNYDEVAAAAVHHPTRFTLNHTMNYQVWPATAHAGIGSCSGGYEDANHTLSQLNPPTSCAYTIPPMGEIFRLSSSGYSAALAACPSNTNPQSNAIIVGMRQYGIELADNGCTGCIVGTPDARWSDSDLACLRNMHLSDFEAVKVAQLEVTGDVTNSPTYQALQPVLTGISVSPSAASIPTVQGTQQFTPTCSYNDGSQDGCTEAGGVNWTPTSGSIATVNSSGLATAGTTKGAVTVTATNGSISGVASLTTFIVSTGNLYGLSLSGLTVK